MATNKLGTLVYDLVADTQGFQKGLVKGGRQLTALKKLFLESRTPVEAFGIQLQGMHRMIMDGAKPINMFSRSIADLALKTKGGGREARNFVQSLRDQASQMIANVGQYRVLSQADRTRVDRLRAVANAIEREVNIQRQSAAEKLKNKRALEQETAAAKEADAEQKRLSQEREKQIAIERRQAEQRIAYQQKIDRLRQQSRARAKSEGIRQAEQQEASRLAMVRSELQKTISPQQRLVSLAAAARAAYAAGNITQKELLSIQKRITEQLRELNPELRKEAEHRQKLAEATAKQAREQERLNAERRKQAQSIRDRQDPRRALAREMTDIRALGAAGMLSPKEVAAEQKRILQAMNQLNPAYREQQERLARVQRGLQNLITPQAKVRTQMRELVREYRAGNVSYNDTVKRLQQLKKEHRELSPQINQSTSALKRFGAQMFSQVTALAQQISAISLAYTVFRQGTQGIAGALELGRSQKEFEIFTGSAETSMALMSGIRNLAAETPLTMGVTTQSARTLLQYGTAADRVLEVTRQLGDISGGATERMQRLALAMGQITANGRLQGQELRQLVEAGFNPLQVLSKELNVSMMELRIRMAEGSISAEDIAHALKLATSEGGRFADALQRIGDETAFGGIQKLRGEYEKLRDEAYGPTTELLAMGARALTSAIRAGRKAVRFFAKGMDEESRDRQTKLIASEAFFGLLTGNTDLLGNALSLLTFNMIEVERRAIEMEQAQIEASEGTEVAYNRVNEQVTQRIAALRKEREEIELGADQAELNLYRRQGATDEFIDQLRQELELTKKIREEDEKRAEVARKAKKIIEERDKNKEWWKDWFRARRNQPEMLKTAKEFADLIKTPFDRLIEQLKELRGVAHILDEATMRAAEQQLKDQFIKSQMEKERIGPAAAATRGSVEEFRLLQEMSGQKDQDAERRHQEQLLENKLQNENLADASTKLSNLPEEIANRLETYFATSVA